MLNLSTINAMPEREFLETFQGVYESSPWVAQQAYAKLPFSTTTELVAAFRSTVDQAASAQQLDLITAHPDLGGKMAQAGQLTAESTREQSRLGLDRLDPEAFATFTQLNAQYRERFHFPFIICVGLLQHQSEIMTAFRSRIAHTQAEEHQEALRQIHLIARLRLANLIANIPPP